MTRKEPQNSSSVMRKSGPPSSVLHKTLYVISTKSYGYVHPTAALKNAWTIIMWSAEHKTLASGFHSLRMIYGRAPDTHDK
jgi:hypothetical protein